MALIYNMNIIIMYSWKKIQKDGTKRDGRQVNGHANTSVVSSVIRRIRSMLVSACVEIASQGVRTIFSQSKNIVPQINGRNKREHMIYVSDLKPCRIMVKGSSSVIAAVKKTIGSFRLTISMAGVGNTYYQLRGIR